MLRQANLFRVAFLLERMCPLADGLGSKFNETHFDKFKEAVDYISVTKGACKSSSWLRACFELALLFLPLGDCINSASPACQT